MTIAALYVDPRGCYAGLDGVDLWDEARDARRYAGPWPVVAHPPCTRWCRLAGLVEARHGYRRGDDGGCFAAALSAVRRWGGVLEHPAWSEAWVAYDMLHPPTGGGWVRADFLGGWTCYVEQGRYGHPAKKATWLYAFGVELPSLRWGHEADHKSTARVRWASNPLKRQTAGGPWTGQASSRIQRNDKRPRLGKRAASATPPEFRDVLIAMARSASNRGVA